jgi:hypothetical protein
MRAVRLDGEDFRLEEIEKSKVCPEEFLVGNKAATICH